MNILITGGSGLIGTHLTKMLLKKGHSVSHLSRKANDKQSEIKRFLWDVSKKKVDQNAFKGIDCIIHLAGEGIVDKRWTTKRKSDIISSRTESLQLIYDALQNTNHTVKVLLSASGIGYYGADRQNEKVNEGSSSGNDFVAQCCIEWEKEALRFEDLGLRSIVVRTGIVLSKQGGALEKMATPIKYYLGAPIGSGKQWQSWIHIDDLCELMCKSIREENCKGIYNGVAPQPVINEELTAIIAKVLSKPLWLPNIPSWVIKLFFGEISDLLLGGVFVDNARIREEGTFVYQFPECDKALKDILEG